MILEERIATKTKKCDSLAFRGLRNRGIITSDDTAAPRFYPRCYYRPDEDSLVETWPAMIAAVTDLRGRITGVHRTWLDPGGFDPFRLGKAPVATPRRAIGIQTAHTR
jgi:hypothetical protein